MRITIIRRGVRLTGWLNIARLGLLVPAALLGLLSAACGPNEGILRSGRETPSVNSKTAATPVERDVEDMRTANFTLILVVKRKDNGSLDAEDRSVLKAQTWEANRRIASDDGTAVVIGSNGLISPDKMAALQARFTVEDHSPPQAADQSNTANANR